jgi:hypothetical protein
MYETTMHYVISACGKKMKRRFDHGVSMRYFENLKDYRPKEDEPFVNIEESREEHHYASDHDFLSHLSNIVQGHQNWPKLSRTCPNLLLMSRDLPDRGQAFQLYTAETCWEFHRLLVWLFAMLQQKIEKLQDALGSPSPTNIKSKVAAVYAAGFTLWKMCSCKSFETHLRSIEHHLPPRPARSRPAPSFEEDEDDDPDVDDTTSATSHDGKPLKLWASYRNWALLMVVHFEAVVVIRRYVGDPTLFPHDSISIKLLLGGYVEEDCLPWEKVFQNPSFFPGSAGQRTKMLNFLLKARDAQDQLTALRKVKNTREKDDLVSPQVRDKLIKTLLLISNSAYAKDVQKIEKSFQGWFAGGKDDDIAGKIDALEAQLVDECDEYGRAAQLGHTFQGTLHCESIIASLLDPDTRAALASDGRFNDVLDATKVSFPPSSPFVVGLSPHGGRTSQTTLEYRNVAAHRAETSSPFYQIPTARLLHVAFIPLFRPAPYRRGRPKPPLRG